jgi:hypothetical protein
MASDPVTESIADRVAQSLAAFEAIDTVETGAGHDDSQFTLVQTVISDQLSRFKLWAGNIGAHRTGRSSLDYRLRDSSHLHTQVMRLLDDLSTSLNEGLIRNSFRITSQSLTGSSAFNPMRRNSSVGPGLWGSG